MSLLNNPTGLYVGSWVNPRTGVIHYLRDTSGVHIGAMGPTRSGKLLCWVLPNLLSYTESAFIYDPKGELWQLSAGWRRSIGQNVLRWQPGHSSLSCGFNFLDGIRLNTDYEVADAQNIAIMLVDPDGAGFSTHWDKAAFGYLTGAILHVLHVARDSGKTTSLPDLTKLLSSPVVDPMRLCAEMAKSQYGDAINAAGVDQIKRDEKERGAVLSTVKTYLNLFLDPIVARNTRHSSFRIEDLMDHHQPTSLYVMAPGSDSVRMRPLIRLFITVMINRLVSVDMEFDADQRPISPHKRNMVLFMEEFPDLRKMMLFEAQLAIMGGAGLTAMLIMQDREQLLKSYGERQTIMANLHLIAAFAPNEGKTAKWLSEELGNKTVNLEQFSASGKRGGWLSNLSHSYSSFGHPLMTPSQVKRMKQAKKRGKIVIEAGEMLIMPTGQRPIFGRQILYFEDPVFLARSRIAPPDVSDNLELLRSFTVREDAFVVGDTEEGTALVTV